MSTARKCSLCCINNKHKPINLPHNEPIDVGRTPTTGITDTNVSRKQVTLVANCDVYQVKVKCIGLNPSGANGFCLQPSKEYIFHHKDRLELLLNNYIYEIIFDPEPKGMTVVQKRKLDSETEEEPRKTIKLSQDSKEIFSKWEEIDEKQMFIYSTKDVAPSKKIAAYDLDGTIITTKSGARFPKDANDWRFLYPEVQKKLSEQYEKGFKIVIFSNQAGISQNKLQVPTLREKIESIAKKLNIPIQVFLSTGKGIYRKPAPGMWNALCQQKNNNIKIDMTESYYCGDAAGREKNWAPHMKKDHSIGDKLFALNIGLKFLTPEQHFLGSKQVPAGTMPKFDPKSVPNSPLFEPTNAKIISDKQEVVVLVGSPASGKSYFCKKYIVSKGYAYISRDQLGSWQKCVSAMENELRNKRSVVVDNTNPDHESRRRYVDIAKRYSVPCRCFVMATSVDHAKHNNLFRQMTDRTHKPVTDIIINSYKKNYVTPTAAEGYTEIININCLPTFDNKEHEALYNMFLLEK